MSVNKRSAIFIVFQYAALLAGLSLIFPRSILAEEPGGPEGDGQVRGDPSRPAYDCIAPLNDTPYIPVDSWVYPALFRLYSLGYLDTIFLGMRPYTRSSVDRMLDEVSVRIENADSGPAADEAQGIYEALVRELQFDVQGICGVHKGGTRVESLYSAARIVTGTPLRDSFHLGSTIINDYGRPYEAGFNNYSGASGYASHGRFQLYVRGELQAAPSGIGYSNLLSKDLAVVDETTNFIFTITPIPLNLLSTIPVGPVAAGTDGRLMEAYASAHYLNHEISIGKTDEWLGPAMGAGMAYSNNAEDIYSFRINRIEPIHVPFLSYLTGPLRYDFLIGSLKGHVFPNDPWVHLEKISFRPTENLEFGFERTVIWGGKHHEPVNLHTFLKSFFSFAGVPEAVKVSRFDPGARFGSFDFSYRLPLLRKWLTFYADSEAHDEPSPIDAPRRTGYRPGLYLSHVPGIPKLDVRAEAVNTDPSTRDSQHGSFEYWESIQRQGYTNKGVLFGDWIGREDKGGQAWLTYHLSGDEWLQVGVRAQKAAKDFIRGGTTLEDINFQAVKRIGKNIEINGFFALEHWKAPIYPTGLRVYPASPESATNTTIQVTWYPKNKLSF